MDANNILRRIYDWLSELFVVRRIKNVDEWDGSAARWPDTDAYCADTLIDVNSAAGRDEKAQSHCMLPIREPGDSSDTYVRQAVYASAGGRGITRIQKPDDVPQDAWDSAKQSAANKIISAYQEMDETAPDTVYEIAGKEPPQERATPVLELLDKFVYEMYSEDSIVHVYDFFVDGTDMYAIVSREGKLYKVPFSVGAENEMVIGEWQVIDVSGENRTRTITRQQEDGRWRWVSISATSVLNKAGEIDSTALFDSFVEHAERTGEYPVRQFFHEGESFRIGQADFLARDGYCYVTSGIYDDTTLGQLARKAVQIDPDYWGESIGFYPTTLPTIEQISEVSIPVYTQGINREISMLPTEYACNWFTKTENTQEVMRMKKGNRVYEAFLRLFDGNEESADEWLEQNVDQTNRAIDDEGMVTRDDDEGAQDEQPEGESEGEGEQVREFEIDDELVEVITERVVARQDGSEMEALMTRVDALEAAVAELQAALAEERQRNLQILETVNRDDDDRVEQIRKDMPSHQIIRATYRPRVRENQDDDTQLSADERAREAYAAIQGG